MPVSGLDSHSRLQWYEITKLDIQICDGILYKEDDPIEALCVWRMRTASAFALLCFCFCLVDFTIQVCLTSFLLVFVSYFLVVHL